MTIQMNPFSLASKTVLITGGNSGIGLALARAMAIAEATPVICGRDEAKNREALAQLQSIRPNARSCAFDLSDTRAIPAHFREICETSNGIDILICNAGTQCRGRADTISIEDFEQTIRINLTAPYVLAQSFARARMEANLPGSILMTASLMSEASRPNTSPYTAAKGGIRQLVRSLATDWAPFGIRVNGLGPGYIKTEMTRPLHEDEDFDRWVKGRTPLGRWGLPDDLGGAAVFLASDASAFVTGQIIYVDGGWLATF